jgi:hypothetical protein
MGTDCVSEQSPCPCGKGTIDVEQSSPDHPWVRASQVRYSASLNCDDCSDEYTVVQNSNGLPYLAYKVDLLAKSSASATLREAEKEFADSEIAQRLIPKIIERIDSQTSVTARHRVLEAIHLGPPSISSYRSDPYGGATAVRNISGNRIAHIGALFGASFGFTDAERSIFEEAGEKFSDLRNVEMNIPIRHVKTSATWMEI